MRKRVLILLAVILSTVSLLVAASQPSTGEVERLFREGRLAEASKMAEALINSDPGNIEAIRLGARIAAAQQDWTKASSLLCLLTDRGGTMEDFLQLAQVEKNLFHLEPALAAYERAAQRYPDAEVYRSWVGTLLAYRLSAEAGTRLNEGLALFPKDPVLLENRGALAASLDQDDEAVLWIRKSWDAGADHLAWTTNPMLFEKRTREPYRSLLSGGPLLSDFAKLSPEIQADRLSLLSSVMSPSNAKELTGLLALTEDSEVRRMGLMALSRLGAGASSYFAELLRSPDPGLRRMVLVEMRSLRLPEFVPVLAEYLPTESAPGNHDFAEVLLVQLQIGKRADAEAAALLEAIPPGNAYRFLALYTLADVYRQMSQPEKADKALAEAEAGRPAAKDVESPSDKSAAGLEAYWDCMQRKDIEEVRQLLYHHRYSQRMDARVYGLPENDFDDQQNLSIGERLFLRSWAKKQGVEWPTEGVMQYPREIRHTLKEIYLATGMRPGCSGLLAKPEGPDEEVLQRDGNEVNASGDAEVESECNIVVNPYDQRYIVATSNPPTSSGNKFFRNTSWGKGSWTTGNIGTTSSCDPVSFYNSSGVLYHAILGGNQNIRASYSTDNGATWTACTTADTATNNDREDIYIDTFTGNGGTWPASPCLNKIYIGFHKNGAQNFKVSTGASAPFCTSWGGPGAVSSPGSAGTIGTAITSSIGMGSGSGRGTVLYCFSRYGTSTGDSLAGIYFALSTDCGSTLGTPTRISTINTVGDFEWPIPSTCSRQTYIYPQADSDRQILSAFRNNVYVTWNDLNSACTPPGCSGNTTCNSDIFVARGVPNNRDNPTSWTWTTVNLTASVVGTDQYTDEFYPSLTVDQADGSVYVSYYRSNSGAGGSVILRQQQVHYVTIRSIDGGSTWQPALQVTQQPTNEYNNGADTGMQWGDYTWVDVINGVSYPVWTDRRTNANEQPYVAKVCSEPSHWSERGASPSAPPTTAAPGSSKVINISWTAPDLYWGDGGENNALRKFQLYVDGSLAQDNIAWTTTSTTWTAPDCSASHTFRIRAVNQCGVTKDYGTATTTATGCCTNNPTNMTVTPGGPLTLCQGTAQLLTINPVGGAAPFTYLWTRDGVDIGGATSSTYSANDTGTHVYNCKVTGTGCTEPCTAASSASITWQYAPTFAGATSVTGTQNATCQLTVNWAAASTVCAGPLSYKVYRSTTSPVSIIPANLVTTTSATTYTDASGLVNGTAYYYVVRAVDSSSGAEDANTVERSGIPTGTITTATLNDTFEGSQAPGGFDLAGWSHNYVTGSTDWTYNNTVSQSPTHSWFAQDVGTISDKVLVSPSFGVIGTTQLTFYHQYAFEGSTSTCYDGGTLEYAEGPGFSTWNQITGAMITANGYTGTINSGWSNPIGGKPAFCGSQASFVQVTVNLASLSGKTIKVRWHEGDDSSSTGTGWYVDTVQIQNAGTVGTCTTSSGSNPKEASPSGNMTATAGSGTALTVNFTAGGCTTNHAIYWTKTSSPTLSSLAWGNVTCPIGTGPTGSFDPGALSPGQWVYFVVVGQNATKEGSYGKNSAGVERTPASGLGACNKTQDLTGTCP